MLVASGAQRSVDGNDRIVWVKIFYGTHSVLQIQRMDRKVQRSVDRKREIIGVLQPCAHQRAETVAGHAVASDTDKNRRKFRRANNRDQLSQLRGKQRWGSFFFSVNVVNL